MNAPALAYRGIFHPLDLADPFYVPNQSAQSPVRRIRAADQCPRTSLAHAESVGRRGRDRNGSNCREPPSGGDRSCPVWQADVRMTSLYRGHIPSIPRPIIFIMSTVSMESVRLLWRWQNSSKLHCICFRRILVNVPLWPALALVQNDSIPLTWAMTWTY